MLNVEGLVAGYGGQSIAALPAAQLEAGQCALLTGPSGSGKTTLLLALAGLADIQAGSVMVDGADIGRMTPGERNRFRGRTIGLVFQDLNLITGLSVLDNLLLAPFAARFAQDRDRARSLLDRLGLADKLGQPAETLSRGEAQRVAIARAMLIRPKLILADEPTASLDDASCERAFDLLAQAAAETGAALLIATHDQRLKARVETTLAVEPYSRKASAA